jgi:hypothetical protein
MSFVIGTPGFACCNNSKCTCHYLTCQTMPDQASYALSAQKSSSNQATIRKIQGHPKINSVSIRRSPAIAITVMG